MILNYEEPVFRPPSEAYSLILQVTNGCSWNKCAFCEMYTSKKFRTNNIDEIIQEIQDLFQYSDKINKVFLADGNAMCLSTEKLLKILNAIKKYLPKVRRISTYALPNDVLRKSLDELKELNNSGLKLLYIGIESGDDELLKLINKGETYKSTVDGLNLAQDAGLKNSVMIINGLGGKNYSEQHAINSAKIINEIQPAYLSTLVLSFPYGIEHFKNRFKGEFIQMNQFELLQELRLFIENLNLSESIFRSDHASNYLVLKGNLPRDKERIINKIDYVLNNPDEAVLRPEWMRGL